MNVVCVSVCVCERAGVQERKKEEEDARIGMEVLRLQMRGGTRVEI
jgi:hypothetical protein